MKYCIYCKKDRAISSFSKSNRTPDGLKNTCESCLEHRKQLRQETKERLYELNRSTLISRFLSCKNFSEVVG